MSKTARPLVVLDTGWTFESIYGEDHCAYKLEELEEAGSVLLGRKTYEGFAAAWPNVSRPEVMKKLKLKDAISYDSGVALPIYERAEG